MNTKAIYMPKGKAGEYAKYACNFYVGCSNDCQYCYCKKGILGHAMGAPKATLKKCFKDEKDALDVFRKELVANLDALKKHGLFFTFTSDPWLPETRKLTIEAVRMAVSYWIPCKILTKRADFIDDIPEEWIVNPWYTNSIALGFSLTGCDDLELGASLNSERIKAMKTLSDYGFKTFASIEPVIDIQKSFRMIEESIKYCDHYKIGLLSGKKEYTPAQVQIFMNDVYNLIKHHRSNSKNTTPTVYFKDSLFNFIKWERAEFPLCTCPGNIIVNSNYNIFTEKEN